jgi:endonuclease YncB( thermonuclease family)
MAMAGWRDGVTVAALAMMYGCFCAEAQEPQKTVVPCGGEIIATGAVRRVVDGRSFVLNDGRIVRLAAIEVPLLPLPQDAGAAPGGEAAKNALAALLGGAQVVLRRAAFLSDRYGRTMAYAYTGRDNANRLAQAELISAGFARVGDNAGSRICAAALLRRESAARQAKLGLWANPYYDALRADRPADVLARRGRFAIVEGKVVSVRQSGAIIYMDFGRRWSTDFTVTILKRNARKFAAAGLDLRALTGRRVRVRGFIEERSGPWIEAVYPQQIEPADRN